MHPAPRCSHISMHAEPPLHPGPRQQLPCAAHLLTEAQPQLLQPARSSQKPQAVRVDPPAATEVKAGQLRQSRQARQRGVADAEAVSHAELCQLASQAAVCQGRDVAVLAAAAGEADGGEVAQAQQRGQCVWAPGVRGCGMAGACGLLGGSHDMLYGLISVYVKSSWFRAGLAGLHGPPTCRAQPQPHSWTGHTLQGLWVCGSMLGLGNLLRSNRVTLGNLCARMLSFAGSGAPRGSKRRDRLVTHAATSSSQRPQTRRRLLTAEASWLHAAANTKCCTWAGRSSQRPCKVRARDGSDDDSMPASHDDSKNESFHRMNQHIKIPVVASKAMRILRRASHVCSHSQPTPQSIIAVVLRYEKY